MGSDPLSHINTPSCLFVAGAEQDSTSQRIPQCKQINTQATIRQSNTGLKSPAPQCISKALEDIAIISSCPLYTKGGCILKFSNFQARHLAKNGRSDLPLNTGVHSTSNPRHQQNQMLRWHHCIILNSLAACLLLDRDGI